MKQVEWIDKQGFRHRALIREGDPEEMAQEGAGVSLDPPDIDRIDWEVVRRDLHNQLVDRGLVSQQDVEEQQNGVTGAVLRALRTKVLKLYR